MTDTLKIERVDNPDGTITVRVTEDISENVRIWRERALKGEIAVIYNIGQGNETTAFVSQSTEQYIAWKKADE